MNIIKLKAKGNKFREDTGKIYFTVDDIEILPEWPDSELIELINGDLFMVPSPTPNHQRISQKIEAQIENFLSTNTLGEYFHAPIDVIFSKEDWVIPDILIVLNNQKEIIKEKRIEGVPAIIIEIASSSKIRDLVDKKELYEKVGVKEYIIIEPEDKFTLVYRLNKDGIFDKSIRAEIPGNFLIKELNDLEINLE